MAARSDEGQDDVEDGFSDLDPRVKFELEKLNAATDGINHLETEFGESQALFRQMVAEAIASLKSTATEIGVKTVEKARPYFEIMKKIHQAGYNLHQAALSYEMAQHHHAAAKKRVNEAESRAFSNTSGKLDPALQEILNQVTVEMMEASKIKSESWEKHQECAKIFNELQKNGAIIQKKLKRCIEKSKPYFELKMMLNRRLEQQKERVGKIQQGIRFAKEQYSQTLKNLEQISDDIHKSRELQDELQMLKLQPREEGVGADSDSEEEISIDGIRSAHTKEHLNNNDGDFSVSDVESCSIYSTDNENENNFDEMCKQYTVKSVSNQTESLEVEKYGRTQNCEAVLTMNIKSDRNHENGIDSNEQDTSNSITEDQISVKKLKEKTAHESKYKNLALKRHNSCCTLIEGGKTKGLCKWLSLPDTLNKIM